MQSSQRGCTCKSTEMYTDHINVTFSAGTIPDLESQINIDLKYIDRWLKAYKLSLNVARTEFMVISSSHKLQYLNAYTMNICIDGCPIIQSNQSQALGLMIDENLSRKAHIHGISRKVSSGIGALKVPLRRNFTFLFSPFFLPRIIYRHVRCPFVQKEKI